MIYLPFIVIDLVAASVLMSMGMMMLSPLIVSLPFKLLLFVLVDGWGMLMGSLAQSFWVGRYMPPEAAITIVGQAIYLVLIIVTALIAPSLLLGLLVAIFQAVTQINEQTLSFLPKLLATLLTIIIFGHWVIMELTTFFNLVFNSIPTVTQ